MSSPLDMEKVVRDYANMIFGLAYRLLGSREDSEEVTQEVFLRLFEKKGEYRSQKNLKNWIYTIALNKARDFYRKSKRRKDNFKLVEEDSRNRSWANESEHVGVSALLQELNSEMREVVVLHYYEDYSVKEISGILKIRKDLVKTRLFRARRKMLSRLCEEEEK